VLIATDTRTHKGATCSGMDAWPSPCRLFQSIRASAHSGRVVEVRLMTTCGGSTHSRRNTSERRSRPQMSSRAFVIEPHLARYYKSPLVHPELIECTQQEEDAYEHYLHIKDNIAEVVMHHPPVNAITVGIRGRFATPSRSSKRTRTQVVILTAVGKGFNAGSTSRNAKRALVRAPAGVGQACYGPSGRSTSVRCP